MLVSYFVLAVVLIVLGLYLAAVALLAFGGGQAGAGPVAWWRPEIFLAMSTVTLAVIFLGSMYKTFELRAGGERIALMLGGRRINSNSTDFAERRVLNIVEEMALASGTPVPPVFLLDREEGINAFAAGFTPVDAVIGINRGTLNYLNRDELQGVIAHEFSHILNGDMRLNIRLIGILHGILLIAIIGYYMLRFGGVSGRSRRRNGKDGGAYLAIMGIAALAIGSIGLLFGRLIKAAVSRQREYLADASAVQFTRNPDSIAGALKKIGGVSVGSKMQSPEAETASHMFFGSAFSFMFGAFATHPPLVGRIRRIDSQFDGRFPEVRPLLEKKSRESDPKKKSRTGRRAARRPLDVFAGGDKLPIDPVLVMSGIGTLDTAHLAYSSDLIASMPRMLAEAVHDPFSGRAVVFAMLLDNDPGICESQLQLLREREGGPTHEETQKLAPTLAELGHAGRLPVIEMVQAALRDLSPDQYAHFRKSVKQLVAADQQISLLEFVLMRVLLLHLDRYFGRKKPPPVRYSTLRAVAGEAICLISALAHAGHADAATAEAAFDKVVSVFSPGGRAKLLSSGECGLRAISAALDKLAQSAPAVKKQLLQGALACVVADGQVTVAEAELLRAIAVSLDCPIPPIVAGPLAKRHAAAAANSG